MEQAMFCDRLAFVDVFSLLPNGFLCIIWYLAKPLKVESGCGLAFNFALKVSMSFVLAKSMLLFIAILRTGSSENFTTVS